MVSPLTTRFINHSHSAHHITRLVTVSKCYQITDWTSWNLFEAVDCLCSGIAQSNERGERGIFNQIALVVF